MFALILKCFYPVPHVSAYCMDGRPARLHPSGMGVVQHIKKLDDALGHFLVRINCKCGTQRIAEPEALVRLCGPSATLEAVGRRMRCSKCGTKGAEVVTIPIPRRRRGFPR